MFAIVHNFEKEWVTVDVFHLGWPKQRVTRRARRVG
jgi:hypothetical protein